MQHRLRSTPKGGVPGSYVVGAVLAVLVLLVFYFRPYESAASASTDSSGSPPTSLSTRSSSSSSPALSTVAGNSLFASDITVTSIDGVTVPIAAYAGKVLLIINVASNCGYTAVNYEQMVTLNARYAAAGLAILAFPCNQFGGQEPGTPSDILTFAVSRGVVSRALLPTVLASRREDVEQGEAGYRVAKNWVGEGGIQMMDKVDVNGPNTHPLYLALRAATNVNSIRWNFEKFLVTRRGVVARHYLSGDTPLSIEGEIVKLLAEEA